MSRGGGSKNSEFQVVQVWTCPGALTGGGGRTEGVRLLQGQTNRNEIIIFPQLSWRAVIALQFTLGLSSKSDRVSPFCSISWRACNQTINKPFNMLPSLQAIISSFRLLVLHVYNFLIKRFKQYRFYITYQEYIPVGCVPPACWPYPSMHWWGVCTCPGECTCLGVYLPRGCTCLGGVPAQRGYLPGGCTCPGGCTWPGSVPARGGVPARGVYLPRSPPPREQNDSRCKNITLPQTSFAGGKKLVKSIYLEFFILRYVRSSWQFELQQVQIYLKYKFNGCYPLVWNLFTK